jgi:hypothetical protein
MRQFIYLILILIFSCKGSPRKEDQNIDLLKYIIKDQINENKAILNYLENQSRSVDNVPINLVIKLNRIALQQIDTALYNPDTYKSKLALSQDEISKNYKRKYDSLLTIDKTLRHFLKNIPPDTVTFEYSNNKSVLENEFLKAQLILIKQNNLLRTIRLAHSPSRCGFDMIPNIGYQIVLKETESLQTIKFFYNTSKWMTCVPKKLIKITTENDSVVELKGVKIKGENLFVTTEKLKKGKYYAEIEYRIIREEGFETEHELTFPFIVE